MNQEHKPPGAFVHANFNLSEGEVLYMLIGQEGESACSPRKDRNQLVLDVCAGRIKTPENILGGGGGGGGGTYVWKREAGKYVPLIVAAGGGGSAVKPYKDPGKYSHGMTATNDYLSPSNGVAIFGKETSGSGGGWNDTNPGTQDPRSGHSATGGGRGGKSCNDIIWDTYGGFGGGGGPCASGGGGGGYKGGDAPNTSQRRDGNGGNSYISHLRINEVDISELGVTGDHRGNGEVKIKFQQFKCSCEGAKMCVMNVDRSGTECICPPNHVLSEDDVCVDSDAMAKTNRVEIFIATCVVVAAFCLCGAGIVCYWIRRRNCRRRGDGSNELQPRNILAGGRLCVKLKVK